MSLDPGSASSPPPFPLPAAAPPEFVINDTPCRKCSYNLRTLPIAGTCPECGAPVGVSIYGNLLRYSDPAWIQNLARGARFILINIFIMIAMMLFGMVLGALGMIKPRTTPLIALQLISLGANILGYLGSWLLTERDPSGIGEDQYGTARKIIRATLLLSVADAFISFIVSLAALPPAGTALIQVISGLVGIASLVGLYALFVYLSKLALRIPDQSLSARANLIKIWLCITYGLLLLIGTIMGISTMMHGVTAPNLGLMMGLGCSAGLIGIAALVFGIMYIFMLDRFRNAFNQQALLAEQMWGLHRAQTP